MLREKKHLQNNNKGHEIKIIQIICCTYCKLWLIIMETLKKRSQNNWKCTKESNSMDIESNSRIQRLIDFPAYPSSVTLSWTTHSTATAQNPNWKTDLQWKKFISVNEKGQTRYASRKKYESKQFRLQKTESDFFLRACNITNALNQSLKFDIMDHETIKELNYNNEYFLEIFKRDIQRKRSMLVDCRCMNCKNIRKLNF